MYARKISAINGGYVGNLYAPGAAHHSSLKTARSSNLGPTSSAPPVHKKLYFQIENNLFYEPEREKGRWFGVRRQIAAAKRRFTSDNAHPPQLVVNRRESRLRFPCVLRNASSLNSLFDLAASDPILTGRHLSKDGTARLASWTDNGAAPPTTSKQNGHKSRLSRARFHSTEATSKKVEKRPHKASNAQKKEPPKPPPKPLFDLSVNLSNARNQLYTARTTIIPRAASVPSSNGSRDALQNPLLDSRPGSSSDLLSDPTLPPTIRNPFENVVINIPVLGFRRCGRTSLLNSLVQTKPTTSSRRPTYYYPMVVFNDQVFQFRLIDCPMMMQDFPLSTLDAWSDFRGWGLHLADFFILVFDITSDLSFQYIKLLREQIIAANMDVPMVIVANKIDLLKKTTSSTGSHVRHHFGDAVLGQRPSRLNVRVFSRGHVGSSVSLLDAAQNSSALYPPQISITPSLSLGSCHKMAFRRDLALLVKKHWKQCVLVECSALYNFNTLTILKEVMRFVQYRQTGQKASAAQAVQAAWQRNQCSIL